MPSFGSAKMGSSVPQSSGSSGSSGASGGSGSAGDCGDCIVQFLGGAWQLLDNQCTPSSVNPFCDGVDCPPFPTDDGIENEIRALGCVKP